jgi:hypothetical protein
MTHRSRLRSVTATLATLGVLAGVAACDNSKITELNQNPNSPEDVPATTLFTNAAQSTVSRYLGGGYSLRETEFLIQHFAEQQYPDEDRYARLGASDTQGSFTNPYNNELEDLTKVVAKGTAASQPGVFAPAQILKIWTLSYITNSWGDVPYSQALAGDSAGGSIKPVYDPQKDIFADFFLKLDAAGKALSSASADLGSADPIYKGVPASWQKFANSLRARLALLLVNVDPATATAQLRAAFTAPGGLITSNADNALLRWPGDGVYDNPWAGFFRSRDDNRLSQTLVNPMLAMNDPRLPVYAQPLPGTTNTYAGMPNGLSASAAGGYLNKASRGGAVFFPGATAYGFFGGQGASFSSFVITAAEINFIEAEAAERSLGGLTPAQAKGFYEAGIRASMAQWGVTDNSAINTFLAQSSVAYAGGTPGLTQIALQKWIALFTDGGTAWAEWRRTCVPNTIKPGPAAISSTVPRRFLYPPTEVSVNNVNVAAAVVRQGQDVFQTPVYWDTKPTAAPTYTAGCGSR